MEKDLVKFATNNPQITILFKPIRTSKEPFVEATWLNGYQETSSLFGLDKFMVNKCLKNLRDRVGLDQKTRKLVGHPITKHRSVQGKWCASLFMKNDFTKPGLLIDGVPTASEEEDEVPNGKLWNISEGIPHPVTGETWKEAAVTRTKELEVHLKKKAERKEEDDKKRAATRRKAKSFASNILASK